MALLDILKKKKKEEEKTAKSVKKIKPKKEAKPVAEPKETEPKAAAAPVPEKKPHLPKEKKAGQSWRILRSPHITEKATDFIEKNQYVFKVFPKANKIEIKKAIEGLYGVEVTGIKIINIPSKKRRLGRIEGLRKGYKKAIVKVKEGQKIEVLPR
jgi:large subunit ribosomal protein L23